MADVEGTPMGNVSRTASFLFLKKWSPFICMRVAIIGTGNIGTDLLVKLLRVNFVHVIAFVGRRPPTKSIPGGVNYSPKGIDFFIENPAFFTISANLFIS